MPDDFDSVVADRFKVLDDVPIPNTWSRVQLKVLDHRPVQLSDEDATMIDLETPSLTADRQTRSRRVAGLLAAAAILLVAVGALVVSGVGDDRERQRAAAPPGASGMIAFVGQSDLDPSTSDIYLVAPDGTGLRPLTSTPGFVEYAPTWSPDGSRLAFVRSSDDDGSWPCATDCQLVVIDPSTGVETFSADLKEIEAALVQQYALVPYSLAWSPDGRAIAISSAPRDSVGNIGPRSSTIADLETGSFTTFTPRMFASWSPDGEWLALGNDVQPSSLLVPTDLIPTGGVVDVAGLAGVRRLPEAAGSSVWMPDSSAMLGTYPTWPSSDISIDVVTVPDGERRTLIENGFDPVVSPNGDQIAYSRGDPDAGGVDEIWIAAADGRDPRRVTTSLTPPTWSPDGSLLLASDAQGWFTVRPDGTGRTPLGIRVHTPTFPSRGLAPASVDWQPAGAHER